MNADDKGEDDGIDDATKNGFQEDGVDVSP